VSQEEVAKGYHRRGSKDEKTFLHHFVEEKAIEEFELESITVTKGDQDEEPIDVDASLKKTDVPLHGKYLAALNCDQDVITLRFGKFGLDDAQVMKALGSSDAHTEHTQNKEFDICMHSGVFDELWYDFVLKTKS
jgi:hypothetical protein